MRRLELLNTDCANGIGRKLEIFLRDWRSQKLLLLPYRIERIGRGTCLRRTCVIFEGCSLPTILCYGNGRYFGGKSLGSSGSEREVEIPDSFIRLLLLGGTGIRSRLLGTTMVSGRRVRGLWEMSLYHFLDLDDQMRLVVMSFLHF